MAITETEYLFVYGTLMQSYRGNPFADVLKQLAVFESRAFTRGRLFLVDYYPGLIETDADVFVYGEKYRIHDSESLFRHLDEYEDYYPKNPHDSLFLRKQISIYTSIHSPSVVAWTYVYNRPTALLLPIEGGNFLDSLP